MIISTKSMSESRWPPQAAQTPRSCSSSSRLRRTSTSAVLDTIWTESEKGDSGGMVSLWLIFGTGACETLGSLADLGDGGPAGGHALHDFNFAEDIAFARPVLLDPVGHGGDAVFQRRLLEGAEDPRGLRMVGERDLHFIAGRQVISLAFRTHGFRNDSAKLVNGKGDIRAHVEDLVACSRVVDGSGDDRRHVVNVGERALLFAVAEDGHRLPFHDLVHEYSHDVAVTIGDVLAFAIDVVGAEHDVIQAEHLMADLQIRF